MLTDLRISGLGVIESAELEFSAGLTVVTGETGAGKTMVVNGLSLLLGERADAGAVRPGAGRAVVEGRWRLPADSPLLTRAADAGADTDGDELLAVRSVTDQGRSRAHLGGTSVPVGLLAELGRHLVSLHSQSDQIDLLRPRRQLEALDAYARSLSGSEHARVQTGYGRAYTELRAGARRARRAHGSGDGQGGGTRPVAVRPWRDRGGRPAAGRGPGHWRRSRHDSHTPTSSGRLPASPPGRCPATSSHAAAADDVLGLLGQARKSVAAMTAHDPRLADLAVRLDDLSVVVGEVAVDLAGYTESVEVDPGPALGDRGPAGRPRCSSPGATAAASTRCSNGRAPPPSG